MNKKYVVITFISKYFYFKTAYSSQCWLKQSLKIQKKLNELEIIY